MNRPKVDDEAYINFLIGTPKVCSATEAARVQPEMADPAAMMFLPACCIDENRMR